jgi:hypothetical protein
MAGRDCFLLVKNRVVVFTLLYTSERNHGCDYDFSEALFFL